MDRTQWLQDRRMQKFRDVLSRWERRELSAMEAGEVLGVSERQFRRYRQRTRKKACPGCWIGGQGLSQTGTGGRDRMDARSIPDRVRRLEREAFSRASAEAARVSLELHVDENPAAYGGPGRAIEAAGRA